MDAAMQDVNVEDDAALALWVDKLSDMLERQQASLLHEAARCKIAGIILKALHASVRGEQKRVCDTETTCRLLVATKIMMRDRRGIESLLTMEALGLFLSLAESADVTVGEEALKCVINSVYSRPDFVRDHALPHSYAQRTLKMTARAAPASFHFMAWKALLVACEANDMITTLVYDIKTWQQIHTTLHFSLRGGGSALPFPSGLDRANLFLELVKLIAVLVNDLKLSHREHAHRLNHDELVATLQPLGDLLLETLRYSPPHMSPFTPELIDLKNKVMEIFMFIPAELLGLFVQQQHEALTTILDHLYTMLVLVRIEKTRMPKDLQPVLVACHHLTSTGDPGIKRFFTTHVFPPPADAPIQTAPRKPAPPAFFHKHLTFFLTSLDTTIKRYMGEWLYLLCDENGASQESYCTPNVAIVVSHVSPISHAPQNSPECVVLTADEYTRRTGLGNAIGLLRIKGLA